MTVQPPLILLRRTRITLLGVFFVAFVVMVIGMGFALTAETKIESDWASIWVACGIVGILASGGVTGCMRQIERGGSRAFWGTLGLAVLLCSAAFIVVRIIRDNLSETLDTDLTRISTSALILMFAVLVTALVLRIAMSSQPLRIARILVLASSWLCLFFTFVLALWPRSFSNMNVLGSIAATWILSNVAAISVFAAWIRLENRLRDRHAAESVASRLRVRLLCPYCQSEQSLPLGPARCTSCRAALILDVQEPRCECGYLLYNLTSNTCPECGREVSESQRWPRPAESMLQVSENP